MSSRETCEHHACECVIEASHAVTRDGKRYCSERCADNRGCDHAGCNCGAFPKAEPPPHHDAGEPPLAR